MKKIYTTLLLALLAILTFAQTPNISMTTTMSIGSQMSFSIRGTSSSTPIQIDWGNGVKESYTIGDMDEAFGFPTKGSTIKIWGQGVEGFNIRSKELTVLEFYEATSLQTLICKNNQITTLNLTGCSALTFVECYQNLISSLTLPTTTTLTYVDCSDNKLTLATLPIKQGTWTTYIYSPQKDYTLSKTVYEINEEIDLSNELNINGNTTTFTWKTKGGTTLLNGVDYSASNGKFTFLKANTDSVNCQMVNNAFPTLTILIKPIKITPQVAVMMITTNTIGNTFSFGIDAAANNTPIQVDFGNGILANFTIGTNSSNISGTLTGNTIRIYGVGITSLNLSSKKLTALNISGAKQLTALSCYSNQIATLDLNNNTALTNIDCSSNKLTTLDVTKSIALTQLDCRSNLLSVLNVSNNTLLSTLNCGLNQLTTLDVTKNIALAYLYCHSNKLTTLDVTKNTGLRRLDCYSNQLTTLDITKNLALVNLICDSNKLIELDVTNNTALTLLHCYSNKIKTLDVSKNTELGQLQCFSNLLSALDITNNPKLSYLSCALNQLTALDVTKNTALTYLNCSSNKLTFNTLPIKQPTWTTYEYYQQAKINLPKSEYALNEEIDLSSHLTTNSVTTNYKWKTKGGVTLIAGTDYTENSGKFNFLRPVLDSIYCEMTNTTFPNLTLSSTAIELPQEPILTMTTTTPIGSSFNFIIRSSEDFSPVKVNWGDGTITTDFVYTSNSIITGTLKGNTIKVYGSKIIYIDVISKSLTSIDISNNTPLKYFFCRGNQLTSIDLTKNQSLLNLDCSYNNLSSLDVSKNTLLWNLDCDNNSIANLDVTNNTALTRLDCGRTSLSSLDITKNTALTELYCAANSLTQLDVSKNTSLSKINCYENKLSSLVLNNISTITEVRCYSNNLNFSTLPINQLNWTTYIYYPQNAIILAKKQYNLTESIDLSNQLSVNGNITKYIWKTKGGVTLRSGTDYKVIGGVTTFLKSQTDSIYCQMTNATFPLLYLSTTNIKITNPTSIDSDLEQATKVYPNPVSNILWVQSEEVIKSIEIYTIVGTKVFEQNYNANQKVNINTNDFPKGLLIVKVYGTNGVMEKKILKK